MINTSTRSRNRLTRYHLRQAGRTLRVGIIYGLLAIAMAYTAVVMLAVAVIGVVATPFLSLVSFVFGPVGDSLFPRP
jgi:hypothetical protein